MAESEASGVPRTPDEPTEDQVLEQMRECEPYRVRDLVAAFDDVSRWTIQRRLDQLVEDGAVSKKKHSQNAVSYWIPDE